MPWTKSLKRPGGGTKEDLDRFGSGNHGRENMNGKTGKYGMGWIADYPDFRDYTQLSRLRIEERPA